MSHVTGQFTVVTDDSTFEVLSRQGGPAGVIGVTTPAGIDIEVDGADISQLTAVRFWHDGMLSADQLKLIEHLFGDQAASIIKAYRAPRPVRVGTARSRLNSSFTDGVSPELSSFVLAHDLLARQETPVTVRQLLVLQSLVASAAGDLLLPPPGIPLDLAELELATLGVPPRSRQVLDALLHDAAALGVLDPSFVAVLTTSQGNDTTRASLDMQMPAVLALSNLSVTLSDASLVAPLQHLRPHVTVDMAATFAASTTAHWESTSNIRVVVTHSAAHETRWWARARRDSDGTVVAVSPLVPRSAALEAVLLVAETDHVVIDVVSAVTARVLGRDVGALARAYDAGRRAARMERQGLTLEANIEWRECARLHGLAGDVQRQKMALARDFTRPPMQRTTLADHLL